MSSQDSGHSQPVNGDSMLNSAGESSRSDFDDNSDDNDSFQSKDNDSDYKEEGASSGDDQDDVPLSRRIQERVKKEQPSSVKQEPKSDDEDDVPLSQRKKNSLSANKKKKRKSSDDDDDDFKPVPKKTKSSSESNVKREPTGSTTPRKSKSRGSEKNGSQTSPGKRVKKEEEPVWRWWEEEQRDDGVKWRTLQHRGPLFPPQYEPLPANVRFLCEGKAVKLSQATEEVATFYGKMLDHEYTSKPTFNQNFIKDWRKVMTPEERNLITDLEKCDFRQIDAYFKEKTEVRKNMTKEEKQAVKEVKQKEQEEYGFAWMDGYKQKIANFRVEPPGLFRGRGSHPKMGRLKKRIRPEDVIINCSKGGDVPVAPKGHRWKEIRHDNTVTWLASWTENISGNIKYIMLNPSSKLKGQKDWEKYEVARKLNQHVERIRTTYHEDMKSKEMRSRQRAVALYFIDKLALRAGNEKDEGESADTVGCCSLRVEHVKLFEKKDDGEQKFVVEFDFLGKDSIRYYNKVEVEKRVFKNLQIFVENKQPGDDLFDRVDTSSLNKYLQDLMPGLTAKVFRTYNASHTLQEQLRIQMKKADRMSVHEKILAYNRANREVAILCNHQRAAPKTFQKSMETLEEKIKIKKKEVKAAKKEVEEARRKADEEKAKKKYERLKEQLKKLKVQKVDKEENKEIALGTSKLNYLDPRITVAWCKKFVVPLEKVYSKTQREKFQWAIDMAGPDFQF